VQADPTTWTSRSGSSITAQFTGLTNGVVYLKSETGSPLKIALSALDDTSRKQALDALAASPYTAVAPGSIDPQRYIRAMGKLAGMYSHPLFDACFYEQQGQMDIFVKEDGVVKSEPLRAWLHVYYNDKGQSTWVQRKAVRLLEPAVYVDGKVLFRLLMDDGVKAEVFFQAHGNQIDVGYAVHDPPGLAFPSEHMVRLQVLPAVKQDGDDGRYVCARFPERLTADEMKQKAAGWTLALDPLKGRNVRYAYSQPVERFISPLKESQIGGGVYGPRSVSMRAPKTGGVLNAFIYTGYWPWDGYQLSYVRDNPAAAADNPKELATLTVE